MRKRKKERSLSTVLSRAPAGLDPARRVYGELSLTVDLRETPRLLPSLITGAGQGKLNSRLSGAEVGRFGMLDRPTRALLAQAIARWGLSARGYDRVLQLARSCADLAAAERIAAPHVSEAIVLRALDRAQSENGNYLFSDTM